MFTLVKRAAGLVALIISCAALPAIAASTAAHPTPRPFPSPNYPNRHLHVELLVEINKHGQVVRVDHGTLSGDRTFDTMALGNAMQMWIRRPDGSAETGLFRVTYDYNPKTHAVTRVPSLVKAGGSWANKPGAATLIIADARRQLLALEKRLQAEQAKQRAKNEKNLPDINAAVRRAGVKPTPHPTTRP